MKVEKKKKKKKKDKKDKKGKDKKDKKDDKEKQKKVTGNHGKGLVIMFSGCEDHQVSADVVLDGSATGAVSFSFMTALIKNNMNLSYEDLLFEIKTILKSRVKNIQYPQLTCNKGDFDWSTKFST